MKLQVLVCTHKSLDKAAAMTLPQLPGVGYIISCQAEPCKLPPSLQRPDIDVRFTPTTGLSANRNHALDCATAPYVLLADDDLEFIPAGIRAVISAFEADPSIDILCMRIAGGDRTYPSAEQDAFKPYPGYGPCSVEIALRRSSVQSAGLRFNTLFGLGSPRFGAGEEDLLLLSARNRGLKARFMPIDVCRHPQPSTGLSRIAEPAVLRASGAVIGLRYPFTALPRIFLRAMRLPAPALRTLPPMLAGLLYAATHRRSLL